MAKHIDLFSLIKIMFTSKKDYEKLTNIDKERNSFMIQRLFTIAFPVQAAMLSRNGIKGIHIVDFWQKVASKNTRVPGWVYTKTKNNSTKTKPFKYKHTDEAALFYMRKKEWSLKDWEQNIRFNSKDLEKKIDYIDKQINIEIKEG